MLKGGAGICTALFTLRKDGLLMLPGGNSAAGPIRWILAGLGNPGREYENTRHNAGFHALDAVAADCGANIRRLKFKALVGEGVIAGQRCLLMKPDTFMNLSGQAVREAMAFYKIPIERLLVFFDDISLPPGKLRIRRKGSDGGHNGIKNIIYLTGADSFPRVKLGVGAKPHPDYNLADWVLSRFSREEQAAMENAWKLCPEIARLILSGKTDAAMNRFNS